jgi:glycosyltransferase involved in cell wall biosynthesis
MSSKKIVIVHDFLFQYGGAEKVVETWLEMFPEAIVYTSFAIKAKFESSAIFTKAFNENRIKTSFAQNIFNFKNKNQTPVFLRFQKHLFWLYPLAMRTVSIKNADLVLISSTDCAKQVRLKNCSKIIHYCHSPTRYLNSLTTDTEHATLPLIYRLFIPFFTWWLKILDQNAVKYLNQKNTIWLANSDYIQKLIWEVYHTQSQVVYPPIQLSNFLNNPRNSSAEDFYLCHGRISFHKRIDLAIEACLKLNKRLIIGGETALAKQMDDLKQIVSDFEKENPDKTGLVTFLGRTTDQQFLNLLSKCKAFLFPGKEDFGITPIEVLAAGVPIVAFAAGGALEYIENGSNGIFFDNQTIESLSEAIQRFESFSFGEKIIRESSKNFDEVKFKTEMINLTRPLD